jgi:hypothetical protein
LRLIDADALKENLIKERDTIPLTKTERYGFGVEFPDNHGMSMRGGINKAFRCMEETPTIDAVPVVRCKDCVGYREEDGVCVAWEGFVRTDDFCSYGERRSDA